MPSTTAITNRRNADARGFTDSGRNLEPLFRVFEMLMATPDNSDA
jgi:hypothetical protein